jgi:hypothetical protein
MTKAKIDLLVGYGILPVCALWWVGVAYQAGPYLEKPWPVLCFPALFYLATTGLAAAHQGVRAVSRRG